MPCPDEFHSCLNASWGTHCRGDNKPLGRWMAKPRPRPRYLTERGSCVSTCPAGHFRRAANITGVTGELTLVARRATARVALGITYHLVK